MLEGVSSPDPSPHCVSSVAVSFMHPGKVPEDGMHQCFVTEVFGGDVRSLQEHLLGLSQKSTVGAAKEGEGDVLKLEALPLPLVKRILLHTLRGLAHLHERGIVHTDLKPDNIMFSAPPPPSVGGLEQYYERVLADDPPRLNPPEPTWTPREGTTTIRSAVSQPLPLPATFEEAMERVYLVADLGSGKWKVLSRLMILSSFFFRL